MDWTSWQENWASVGQNLTWGCKEKWLIYGSAQFRKVYTNDFLLTARATISLSSKSRNWNQEVEKLKKQLGKNPVKVGVFVTWLGISSNNHRTSHSIDEVPPLCSLIPALGWEMQVSTVLQLGRMRAVSITMLDFWYQSPGLPAFHFFKWGH